MYGLSEQTYKQLITIFASYPEVEEAIMYGSRARDNYKPYSDLDITLKGQDLQLSHFARIEEDIDNLLLPVFCDLSNYDLLTNPDLKRNIMNDGKVLYRRKP